MPLNRLTEEQINDFQEVGNIGAGNAASRLSDLIHHPCTINIPEVRYLNPEEIKKTFETESAFAVAIFIKVMGDIPAVMLVIMKRIYAHKVVEHMTRASGMITGKDFSFTAKVALKQLGELLTKSFSDSIAQFLRTKAKFAMPEIIIDTWTMTIDTVLQRISRKEEEVLVVHSMFFDPEKTFEGEFVYVLNQESQDIILHRINLLLGGN